MEEDISEVVKDEKCWLLNGFGNEWSECEKKCDCISNSFFCVASTLLCYASQLALCFSFSNFLDKSRVTLTNHLTLLCYLFPS